MFSVMSEKQANALVHEYFPEPIHKKIVLDNIKRFNDFREGYNNKMCEFLWSLMQVSYDNIMVYEYSGSSPDPLNSFIIEHYSNSNFIMAASNTLIVNSPEPIVRLGDGDVFFLKTMSDYGLNAPDKIDKATEIIQGFSEQLILLLRELYFIMGINTLGVGWEKFTILLNTDSISVLSIPVKIV